MLSLDTVTMHRPTAPQRVAIGVALATLLCLPRVFGASAAPPADEFKGRLLVSSSHLYDPRFERTVVLIVEHDENGAFGLVVNRPAGTVTLSHLFKNLLVAPKALEREVTLYFGGPVELDAAFLLHSSDASVEGTKEVLDGVSLSMGPEILEKLGEPGGPSKFILLAGYAGWGAGQLERECKEGAWYTFDASPALIFAAEPDKTWDKVIDKIAVRF